nr:MAG TPA: hypothetical protein [Caudoviricetes sp.]
MWSKNRVPLKYDIFKGPHCGEGLFFCIRGIAQVSREEL